MKHRKAKTKAKTRFLKQLAQARKPRVLRVGSRQVVVETEPLEENPTFKALALQRTGEQLLVLKTPLGVRLIALVPFLVGALFICAFIVWREWWTAFGGGLFLLVALLTYLESVLRVELDASALRMRTIWLWKRWERPLKQLLAVQLTTYELSDRYYLALVLDDEKQRRTNLTWFGKEKGARDAGKELASFLGKPLLDEVSGVRTEESRH
jgi:hypothetical protein